MPTFNDPNMARAFTDLGKLFAPPSARDVYAYAKAKEARQSAELQMRGIERLRQVYADNPRALGVLEAMGAAGMRAMGDFNLANAAAAPGATPQGLDALMIGAKKNYDDTHAGTQDKLRNAIAQRRMMEQGLDGRAAAALKQKADEARVEAAIKAGTLNPGQQRNFNYLPEDVRKSIAPGAPDVGFGAITAKPGDRVYLNPGAPQPSDDPTADWEGEAPARAQPLVIEGAPKPVTAAKPSEINYKTPSGDIGVAAVDSNGRYVDAITRDPLPPGTTTFKQSTNELTSGSRGRIFNTKQAIVDARSVAQRLRKIAQEDPTATGWSAAIIGTAQNLLQGATELSSVFGGIGQKALRDAEQMGQRGGWLKQLFNPNIPATEYMLHSLAYKLVRMDNPVGEVGQRAFEKKLASLRGGSNIGTTAGLLAVLDKVDQDMSDKENSIRVVDEKQTTSLPAAPGVGAGTAPATPGGATPDGTIIKNPTTGEQRIKRNGKWESYGQ